ncbi:MAG: recombinase family protein [Planctomycetaceae bacterium]|nr:recombinase family protein [Planctomycetaceae bacterium]
MAIRKKDRGLIYLRRSSGRQELSLGGQLSWAIARAAEEGVIVDATVDDLEHMRRHGLHSHKDIRLDDSISGADMSRPGFLATQYDVGKDRRISHLFVHMRDRFGRPEDAMQMATIEKSIRKSGVTIILSNGVGEPMEQGRGDLGEDLKVLVEYYMSGDFLRKLSQRIIDAHRTIASMGCWTGGSAPYGCTRVLVDAKGNFLEELPPGRTVRQPGCHVQIRPKDEAKIKWWIHILDLSHSGWGAKRIANLLNELGVPSPNAGRIRKDRGVAHVHDGKWNHRTVLDLIKNPAIIGEQRYGRRSMGAHHRLSETGHRLLDESDRTETGTRVVYNAESIQIRTKSGFEAAYDAEKWKAIQDGVDARGRSQAGIPRNHDPAKYPLACRLVDMTDDCGSLLYARTSGNRPLYSCGRYQKSGSSACGNNTVDGEAMLAFVLKKIELVASRPDIHDQLRKVLEERIKAAEQPTQNKRRELEEELAVARRKELESKKQAILQNLQRLTSVGLIQALQDEYEAAEEEIKSLDALIATASRPPRPLRSIEVEVDAALSKLHWLREIARDPSSRAQWPDAIKQLGVRAGLVFETRMKGKRKVQALRGGVLVFRDAKLPIELFGRDRVEPEDAEQACEHSNRPSAIVDSDTITVDGESATRTPECGQKKKAEGVETPSASNTGMNSRPKEGFSSTKVSRGDRRLPFPNDAGALHLFWHAIAQTVHITADAIKG